MECKEQLGSCPDFCVSYKFFNKRKCRNPPKNSKKFQSSQVKLELTKAIVNEMPNTLEQPHIMAYMTLRSLLNNNTRMLLNTIISMFNNISVEHRDDVLRSFDLSKILNISINSLNKYLEIFYLVPGKLSQIRLAKILILSEREFIKKYKYSPSLTTNNIVYVYNHLAKNPRKEQLTEILNDPRVITYTQIRDRIFEKDFVNINNILEVIEKGTPENVKESPKDLLEYVNNELVKYDLCIIMNLNYTKEEALEMLVKLTSRDLLDIGIDFNEKLICYLFATVIITEELELISQILIE
jgi:hypothetical protein